MPGYEEDYDHSEDDVVVKGMKHLYQLRHACNVFGHQFVADELQVGIERVRKLHRSMAHGSVELDAFFKAPDEQFAKLLSQYGNEEIERERRIDEAQRKNERLVEELQRKRKMFAGIGTNRAKRRLNKLALSSPIAQAVRLALEIEDKSISAKNSYGGYQEKIYDQKEMLIFRLCSLFKGEGWPYGIESSNNPSASHVAYFEIPGCEQVSWHFSPGKMASSLPRYGGKWDKKKDSTLKKLEAATEGLLRDGNAGSEQPEPDGTERIGFALLPD